MDALWGPMEPIPEDRLLVVDEGDRIPLGRGRSIEVLATPGHAKHHVVFLEDESGGAFVGDAVGLAFPHGHMVQPVAPPPDFDPRLVTTQLRRLADRDPGFLGFAHFGPEREPLRALAGCSRQPDRSRPLNNSIGCPNWIFVKSGLAGIGGQRRPRATAAL